ncbi:LamG domain-containing protein [Streptomyces sp. NPDC051567]|uniref:LamG domain-containing protein n=1 Tax=Streptomyces sp. NPDC051567 TaxID=3365660 RepID=UPI0037B5CB70
MTDGTPPPSNPQPEPAPGSGGYGFPPGPPPGGGYGYPPGPPAGGGYGYPPGAGGYGYPQQGGPNPYQRDPGAPWPPAQPGPPGQGPAEGAGQQGPGQQPDWEAMADRSAAERRRKRLWMLGGAVTVLALLGGGGAFLLLGGDGQRDRDEADAKPSASAPAQASATPGPGGSKAPVDQSPTVAGDPTLLRDRSGQTGLRMGSEAAVFPMDKRYEVRMKGSANSYAQSAEPVVDTSKSFSVSARVYNVAPKGARFAVSQGDGESFSFELGADEVNGKLAWVFRVQTGDQGADSSTRAVVAEGAPMERTWTALTGTYDAEKKTVALYVDGKRAGEVPVAGVWQGPGPLQLGRARHHGIWTGMWNGAVDNVRVFAAALSQEQVTALRAGKPDPAVRPTGSWLIS